MYTFGLLVASLLTMTAAQTPSGTSPSCDKPLDVQFESVSVPLNGEVSPDLAKNRPIISSKTQFAGKYMLFMLDLDLEIPGSISKTANLTPGLEPGRTTLLHWWAGNLTQATNGVFNRSSYGEDIAMYRGPEPPAGDIPHVYTLYLFEQPDNYSLPPLALNGTYKPIDALARFSFSLENTVKQAGQPSAATHFSSMVPDATNGSASGGGCQGSGCPSSTSPSVAQGVSVRAPIGPVLIGIVALFFGCLIG